MARTYKINIFGQTIEIPEYIISKYSDEQLRTVLEAYLKDNPITGTLTEEETVSLVNTAVQSAITLTEVDDDTEIEPLVTKTDVLSCISTELDKKDFVTSETVSTEVTNQLANSDTVSSAVSNYLSENPIDGIAETQLSNIYDSGTDSLTNAYKEYLENKSSVFYEKWNDFNNWEKKVSTFTIENGKTYCKGNSNTNFKTITNTEKGFASFKVNIVNGTGGCVVGFATEQNPSTALSLNFDGSSGIKSYIDGSQIVLNSNLKGGEYTLNIFYNANYVSFMVVDSSNVEYYYKVPRNSKELNYIYIQINDTNSLGNNIGEIYHCNGYNNLLADRKPCLWFESDMSRFKIYIPSSYNPLIKNKAIICFHGAGSDESTWDTNGNMVTAKTNFVDNGYVVLTCSHKTNTTTWGCKDSTKAYYEAYLFLIRNFGIESVGIYANSMGGIESLNALTERKIKAKCWGASSPTYDLSANFTSYADGKGEIDFSSSIISSYGITSDGSDFEEKTKGRNPKENGTFIYGGIPMYIISGDSDTAVPQDVNGMQLYKDVLPMCDATLVTVSGGGHSFGLTNYISGLVDFYKANL